MQEKHLYCVKCNAGKTVVGQSPVMFRNGSVAMRGKCPSCNNTAYKIVSKDALKQSTQKKSGTLNPHLLGILTFALGFALGAAIITLI